METRKKVWLFLIGVGLGVGMFFMGGIGVSPAHTTQQPTAQLQPWLQKSQCDYPSAVDCTSQGSVITSPSTTGGG